jgi:uncharacterized membrane protein YhfC
MLVPLTTVVLQDVRQRRWVILRSKRVAQYRHLNVLTAVLFAAKQKAEWYENKKIRSGWNI